MLDPAVNFYQTLIAAASEASEVLVGSTKMIESVYLDYKPEVAPDIGQTLNINIPANASAAVSDIGTGDFSFSSPSTTVKSLVFNKHPSAAYVVTDFSQFNTPADVRTRFLDSYLKAILENVNTDLCSLLASANFTSSTPTVVGAALGWAKADVGAAWGELVTNKVPVNDLGDFFGIVHPKTYAAMLEDDYWTANSQIGYQLAGQVRRYAMLGQQWGALIDYDHAVPVAGTTTLVYSNALFHRHAIALAVRPLPLPQTNVVEASIVNIKGIPFRIMLGYNQTKQGWVTTVDTAYARGVIRPEMGVIVSTTETP